MASGNPNRRRRSTAKAFAVAFLISLSALAGTASAGTGGASIPGGEPAPKGSTAGTATPAPSADAVSIASATTRPRKSFYFGFRFPRLSFTIASTRAQNDLQVNVIADSGEVVRSFFRRDVAPGTPVNIRWDGTNADGRPARNGHYSFRVLAQGAAVAARLATSPTAATLDFDLYGYAFPIVGEHEFGMSAGRFGAGRSGHTHQGQDTMAACGLPLVAARGGTIQYSGYQDAAGNYVVIDGKGTGYDFMYAHLAEPSPLQTGEIVRTGQPIGLVGDTGDASGCHLHFEIWTAPGWYEGGSPIDPLPYLQRWDRYS